MSAAAQNHPVTANPSVAIISLPPAPAPNLNLNLNLNNAALTAALGTTVLAVVNVPGRSKSVMGNIINAISDGRGSNWLNNWRLAIYRNHVTFQESAGCLVMVDDFRNQFPTEYTTIVDPVLLQSYSFNLIKNTRKVARLAAAATVPAPVVPPPAAVVPAPVPNPLVPTAFALPAAVIAPALSAASSASVTPLLSSTPTAYVTVVPQRSNARNRVAVPLQIDGVVASMELDISRLYPVVVPRQLSYRNAFSQAHAGKLAARKKAMWEAETDKHILPGDSRIHHRALSELILEQTDTEKIAADALVVKSAVIETESMDNPEVMSFRNAGQLYTNHLHRRTGLAVFVVCCGHLEDTDEWVNVWFDDDEHQLLRNNPALVEKFDDLAFKGPAISAQNWPLATLPSSRASTSVPETAASDQHMSPDRPASPADVVMTSQDHVQQSTPDPVSPRAQPSPVCAPNPPVRQPSVDPLDKDNEVNEDGPNATVAFTTGEDVVPQENDQAVGDSHSRTGTAKASSSAEITAADGHESDVDAEGEEDEELTFAQARVVAAREKLAVCLKGATYKWVSNAFEMLLAASQDADWLSAVCAWARLQCRYASLSPPTITHSIPEDGRPDALSELITSRSALVPDDLSNLHEQMHTWLMRLQPASRRPQKGFRKMKLAKDVDPIEFDSLRCTTSRGLVLVMTGLSWLYKSNCPHFPNIPSCSDLVNEMTAILKVMRKLPVPKADVLGILAESPIPSRVSSSKRKSTAADGSPTKKQKHAVLPRKTGRGRKGRR